MAKYPAQWVRIDSAAQLLQVGPRMALIIAKRENWRRAKADKGFYVYAIEDVRATERKRRTTN